MAQQTPGMNCPQCNQFIPTTINELLTAQGLRCPYCGLQLTINRAESKRAMDILKDVQNAQDNVNATANRYK
ncbi:MAG: hypothetical protein HUK02_07315 [Bacteroidaceae bacterium]|nr:hypothetical protein [Bacteroidaceae bacterium]